MRKTKRQSQRRRAIASGFACAAVACLPTAASALGTKFWKSADTSGNWSVSNNWSISSPTGTDNGGVPGSTDAVAITATNGVSHTVNYDYTGTVTLGAGSGFTGLTIDLTGGSGSATNTLNMSANTLTVNAAEIVGLSGVGAFNQTGGSNTVQGNALFLGSNLGSAGTYTLGTTGGTTSTGTLNVGANEAIGYGGYGSFTQNSGTHTLSASGSTMYLAYSYDSDTLLASGNYVLNSGNLAVNGGDGSVSEYVGYGGQAIFNQHGGSNVMAQGLTIGNSAIGDDFYTMDNTVNTPTLTVGGDEVVANLAKSGSFFSSPYVGATFTQNAGTHTIHGSLKMAIDSASSAVFNLNSGSLSADTNNTASAGEFVGDGGAATFYQSGSSSNVIGTSGNGNLYVGYGNGASGSYFLNSGTPTLTVNGSEYVGSDAFGTTGAGSFNQSAGTHTVANQIVIGGGSPGFTSSGYSLSAGALIVNPTDNTTGPSGVGEVGEWIGSTHGSAQFAQTGGSNTIGSAAAGTAYEDLYIGFGYVNQGPLGASGTYTLNAANASLMTYGGEYVGDYGVGSFTQTAGTNTISVPGGHQFLTIGTGNSSTSGHGVGTYTLNGAGAILTVNGSESIGYNANGTVGDGTTVQYAGTFNQSAGTHTVTDSLSVATFSGDTGLFALSGGILNIATNGAAFAYSASIGNGGTGVFTQTGGSFTVGTAAANDNLFVGNASGANGNYSISGATSSLVVNGNVYVGGSDTAAGGTGVVSLSAPTSTITGNLKIWNTSGSGATFNGGSLTLGGLNTSGNPSLFNWIAGTLNFTNAFTIDNNSLGAVTLSSTRALTNTATLTNNSQITMLGTGLPGPGAIVNNGLITGSGTIGGTGGFTNNGEVIQSGGTLTLSTATTNSSTGTITLLPGPGFVMGSGVILTNSGTINLNGAQISGTGQTINNNLGGTIVGYGKTGSALLNNNSGAIIAVQGGTLDAGALTNNGTVQVAAGATLAGTQVLNNGSILGAGAINEQVNNQGTIAPVAGVLTLAGRLSTTPAGTITAATGNQLVVSSLASSNNDGVIAPNGGTIVLPGFVNQSDGSIIGYGVLTTGGLENKGSILLAGGPVTINGIFENDGPGTVKVQNASALFTSPVTNFGTFTIVSGGSATFAAGGTGTPTVLTNAGTFAESSALISTGNATNSGTATIGGAQTWSPGTTFTNTAGTATFTSDTGSSSSAPLSINVTGGLVNFSSTQHLAGLSVSSGATVTASLASPHNVIVTASLSNAGLINLIDNDLIVQGTSGTFAANLTNIQSELKAGFNPHLGYWNGTSGIASSQAASDSRFLTTIGYRQSGGSAFDNTNTTTNDVLVKYTYYGDADLNGTVNGSDYHQIDLGFGGHLTGWSNGDFNYDGVINGSDYALIDNTFNQLAATGAAPLVLDAIPATLVASPQAATSVPEPMDLSVLAFATASVLGARKRRPEGQSPGRRNVQ